MPLSTSLNRRNFLRAGAVSLLLPRLDCLGANAAPEPQRMVLICSGFGFYGPSFFPAIGDHADSEYLQTLGDLKGKCTVFSGISHPEIGGDHASEACFLTGARRPTASGFRNTISLDVAAASHVARETRFPLLSLATIEGGTPLTYSASGAAVLPLYQPSRVFAQLFLSGGPNQVDKELQRIARGQSILDRMEGRFAAIEKRSSSDDRQRIAEYTESIRETERQLQSDELWARRPKPKTDEPPPSDNLDRADLIGRTSAMLKLARLALQTDSTRVVSLAIRGMDLKPPIEGVTEDHHGLSHHGHNPAKIEQLRLVEKRQMATFAEFLKSLQGVSDGAGTLLDHTQVLIGSNLGDASSHNTSNLPILLAGGSDQHGRHIAGDTRNNTPLAKLFVSMLQQFGVETDRFGDQTGTLSLS